MFESLLPDTVSAVDPQAEWKRQQERRRKAERAALDGVDGLLDPAQRETSGKIWAELPDGGAAAKNRLANSVWLAGQLNRDAGEVAENYDYWRAIYARAEFDGEGMGDDTAFSARVKQVAQQGRDERAELIGDGAGNPSKSLAGQVSEAAYTGKSFLAAWKSWSDGHKGTTYTPDPKKRGEHESLGRAWHREEEARVAKLRPVAEQVTAVLRSERGAGDGESDRATLLPSLRGLDDADLRMVWRMVGDASKGAGDKGLAKATGETIGRTLEDIVAGGGSADWTRAVARRTGQWQAGDIVRTGSAKDEIVGDYTAQAVSRSGASSARPYFYEQPQRSLSVEEAAEWNHQTDELLIDVELGERLRKIGQQVVDPVKGGGWFREKIWLPTVSSAVNMAALAGPASLPVVGLSVSRYSGEEYSRLRDMGMAPAEASQRASVTGVGQALMDRAQLGVFVKAPGIARAIEKLALGAKPATRLAVAFTSTVAAETGIEQIQDHIIPAIVQDFGQDNDAFRANWGDVLRNVADTTPDVILGMLLLASSSASIGAMHDSAAVDILGNSRAMMRLKGYTTEQAQQIYAAAPDARRKLLAEHLPASPPAADDAVVMADAVAFVREDMAAETARAEEIEGAARDAGITISRSTVGDLPVYQVSKGDIITEHADEGSAYRAVMDHMSEDDRKANHGTLEMYQAMMARPDAPTQDGSMTIGDLGSVADYKTQAVAIINDPASTSEQVRKAQRDYDAIENRVNIFLEENPDSPADLRAIEIEGQSNIEQIREGVYKSVIQVANGKAPDVVFEEKVEADSAAWMKQEGGQKRLFDALKDAEAKTGDAYLTGHTGGVDAAADALAVKEAYSKIMHAYVMNQGRRGNKDQTDVTFVSRQYKRQEVSGMRARLVDAINSGGLNSALVKQLKAAAAWLRAVVGRGIRLERARREAGGTLAIDEWLNKSLGMAADATHAADVVEEAERIYGPSESQPTDNESQMADDGPAFALKSRDADSLNQSAPLLEISSEDIGPDRSDWRRAVRDYIATRLQGRIIVNDDSGLEIKFTSESKSEAPAKLRRSTGFHAARRIEDITMSALSLGWKAEAKGRTDGTRGFHYFAMPVRVDGKPHTAWFNARMTTEGSYVFYEFGLSAQQEARTTQGLESRGSDSAAPQSGLPPTVGEFLDAVKSSLPAAQGLTEGTAPADSGPSFRLSPIATLDRLAADIERRKRDPEARRKIYDNMKAALDTLRRNWTATRQVWNGEISPIVEHRSKLDLDKEQAMREALAYADSEGSIYDSLTPSAQAALGVTADDLSAYSGSLGQMFSGRQFGRRGMIQGRGEAAKLAASRDRQIGAEYDSVEGVPPMFFGGTIKPDVAAQEAWEAGLITEPTADALWAAIRKEVTSKAKQRDAATEAMAALKGADVAARSAARQSAAAWRTEQDAMQAKDWDARAVMLRNLRTLDALLSAVPPEVRAKVGGWTAIASLKTQAAMQKELEHRLAVVDEHLEKALKKEGLENIAALIQKAKPDREAGKKPRGKLGAEVHRFFDGVNAVVDLEESGLEARRLALAGEYANKDLTDAQAADIYERELILDTFGALGKPEGHDAAHLTRALDMLEQVYQEGRNRWKAMEEMRLAEVARLAGELVDTWGSGSEAGLQAQAAQADKLRTRLKNGLTWDMYSGSQIFDDLLGEKHPLTIRWNRALREGTNATIDDQRELNRRWKDAMKKAFGGHGLKARKALWKMATEQTMEMEVTPTSTKETVIPIESIPNLKALGYSKADIAAAEAAFEALSEKSMAQNVTISSEVEGVTKIVNYTEAKAIAITMLADQAQYADNLKRVGWTEQSVAQLESMLSDSGKALREFMRAEYRDGYTPLNKVFERMFGVALPQIKGYSPANFWHMGQDKASGPEGDVQNTDFRATALKTRTKHKAEPRAKNAFALFFGHAAQMSHWRNNAEFARELRGVFGNPAVKKALISKYGEGAMRAVTQRIKSIEGNGIMQAYGEMDSIFGMVAKWKAYGALAWNVGTALVQATAATAVALKMNPAAYMRGLGKLATGRGWGTVARMMKSETIQRRMESTWGREVTDALGQTTAAASFLQGPGFGMEFASRGMDMIGNVDAAFTSLGAAIAFENFERQARKQGMDEAAAFKYAEQETDQIIFETAQPQTAAQKSNFELRNAGLAKTSYIFMSDARKNTAHFLKLMIGANDKNRAKALLVWPVLGLLTQAIRNVWQDARDDDDDELFDSENWTGKEFLFAALMGPVNGVPVLGETLNKIATGYGSSGVTDNTVRAVAKVKDLMETTKAEERDKEKIETTTRDILTIIKGLNTSLAVPANVGEQGFHVLDNLFDDEEEAAAKAGKKKPSE